MANDFNFFPSQNRPDLVEGIRSQFDSALGSIRQVFTNQDAYINGARDIAKSALLAGQITPIVPEIDGRIRQDDIDNKSNDFFAENINSYDDTDENKSGIFVDNVYDNIQFSSKYNLRGFFSDQIVEYEDIEIPVFLATVDVKYANTFSKQSTLGRTGTMKHFSSGSDLMINISGVFVSRFLGDEYINSANVQDGESNKNIKAISDFNQMCVNYKTVDVRHPVLTDRLGLLLNNCVIESFSLADSTKYKNLQEFKITLSTDSDRLIPNPTLKNS